METFDSQLVEPADFTLHCSDLKSAQDYYLLECDFRLEAIYPADEPRAVMLSGHGIRLQLERSGVSKFEAGDFRPELVVMTHKDQTFGEGRAGMQYRDLIPGRLGGKYIASHIRIPVGGPVPDYVHHHHIRFQLIYCYQGWVRVVYEDQGPPFVMNAGDCVLQPPHIRHRVLESSDNMEVVEVACPSEHETLVDHDMQLPTHSLIPDREYGGQRFVLHRADKCHWTAAAMAGFEMCDTGISQATNGAASAIVLRVLPGSTTASFKNNDELCLNFILRGSLELTIDNETRRSLQAGDSYVVPPGSTFSLHDISKDLSLLQVTSPG